MRSERWLLAAVIVLGMAARLYQVDYNFDGDEVRSVHAASGSTEGLLRHAVGDTGNAPLHILLLHVWIPLFGNSEVSARAMSLLFSLAFLILAHTWLRRIARPPIAIYVVALLAVSPFFVYFGQTVRPYSLAALLSIANLLAFSRLAEAPTRRGLLAVWAVLSVLLVYALFLGTLLVVCEIAVALLLWRRGSRVVAVCGGAAIASLVPWLAAWLSSSRPGVDPLGVFRWASVPDLTNYLWFHVHLFGEVPGLQARWLLAVLAIIGLGYVKRLVGSRRISADELVLLLLGLGVPALVFMMSVLLQRPFFAARHMTGSAVALMALLGLGLATFRTGFAVLLALALIGWSVAGLPNAFPTNAKPPWRELAARIDSGYGAMPVAAVGGWTLRPLAHYRTTGQVVSWRRTARSEGMDDSDKAGSFLFVCRPEDCAQVKEFGPRLTLAHILRWGYRDAPDQEELRLYEISRLTGR